MTKNKKIGQGINALIAPKSVIDVKQTEILMNFRNIGRNLNLENSLVTQLIHLENQKHQKLMLVLIFFFQKI